MPNEEYAVRPIADVRLTGAGQAVARPCYLYGWVLEAEATATDADLYDGYGVAGVTPPGILRVSIGAPIQSAYLSWLPRPMWFKQGIFVAISGTTPAITIFYDPMPG